MNHPDDAQDSAVSPSGPGSSEFSAIGPDVTASIGVLVVDDERTIREGCAHLLRSLGYSVTTSGSGADVLLTVLDQRFDVILLDLYMQPVGGMDILAAALEAHPGTIVIAMTGKPSVGSSFAALRAGAWDYLPKPFSASHLEILVARATAAIVSGRDPRRALVHPAEPSAQPAHAVPLGASPLLRDALDLARRVARTDASVMLVGEPGTGKTFLARLIHDESRRAQGVLMPVNCGAVSATDLFGHDDRPALLELAAGGTLLLEEPGDLPFAVQAKLLRVFQEGLVRRLGPVRPPAAVDVRLISEMRRDPDDAVRAGALRRDLAAHLTVVRIRLPPLREHPAAVTGLATHFLSRHWVRHRRPDEVPPVLTSRFLEWLRSLPWPGNIRQLEDTMEAVAQTAASESELNPEDVAVAGAAPARVGGSIGAQVAFDEAYSVAKEKVVAQFEQEYLPRLVERAGGNIARAARLASIDRTTLYRLLDKHKLVADKRDVARGEAE